MLNWNENEANELAKKIGENTHKGWNKPVTKKIHFFPLEVKR